MQIIASFTSILIPEHHIFEALTRTCLIKDRESSNYHRCGRTDKGVSAFCQVISINVRSKFGAETIAEDTSIKNEMPYCRLLNRVLPPEIRCIAWKPLKNPNFSARFDCIQRTYRYFFPRGSLDIGQMQEACTHLLGVHDFRNLCKMDVANGVITFIRSIDAAQIHSASGETGSSAFDMMYLEIKGRAFLWHQIRCIMAVLLLVGEGKEKPMVVQQLLDIQAHPKKPQYSLAKDSPLNLYDVQYRDYSEETNKEGIATGATPILEDSDWIHDTDDLGRVISELQRQWTDTAVKQEMMRSMVRDLSELVPQEVRDQHLDLTEGVKAKKYIPLLERQTCESLEERIDHYVKKKRLVLSE